MVFRNADSAKAGKPRILSLTPGVQTKEVSGMGSVITVENDGNFPEYLQVYYLNNLKKSIRLFNIDIF